ncbi:MAG: ribonuclease [Syntrophomonadaceae bacterium]|jgi:guanyl-specific ribonuclease Sa|nr:ribonuclease [Syntrophomonadaceae bacterium]
MKNKILLLLLFLLTLLFITNGCGNSSTPNDTNSTEETRSIQIEKEGRYSKPDEVALYINKYQQLPKNYLTKKEASDLGWESSEGNLWDVSDKMSIGGDIFGNREGKLPNAQGRIWYECDVNYDGGFRGAERLVFSNDGLIYYTQDHYKTFSRISFSEE